MATAEEFAAQLTRVRQEMAKLMQLLDALEKAPAAKKTAAPKK
jgi:prefoldin subunit 5